MPLGLWSNPWAQQMAVKTPQVGAGQVGGDGRRYCSSWPQGASLGARDGRQLPSGAAGSVGKIWWRAVDVVLET